MKRIVSLVACLISLSAIAATPILGPDCGVGTTIVGSEKAGKITLGAISDPVPGCTLAFNFTKTPSCSAAIESNSYLLHPYALATVSTRTTLYIDPTIPWSNTHSDWETGAVVSYLCVGQ